MGCEAHALYLSSGNGIEEKEGEGETSDHRFFVLWSDSLEALPLLRRISSGLWMEEANSIQPRFGRSNEGELCAACMGHSFDRDKPMRDVTGVIKEEEAIRRSRSCDLTRIPLPA